jgi:hypothetical protein
MCLSFKLFLWAACPSNIQACQALKDTTTDASSEALIELLKTIEQFLHRLNIYFKISPTEAMNEVITELLAELLSTLAFLTKRVKQNRSGGVHRRLYGIRLISTQRNSQRNCYERMKSR